jgi:hypothetical protein
MFIDGRKGNKNPCTIFFRREPLNSNNSVIVIASMFFLFGWEIVNRFVIF